MPFALVIIGLVIFMAAYKGKQSDLARQLSADFSGSGSFVVWIAAILLVGAVGYVPALKPVSRAFLALVIVVMLVTNKGLFAQFQNELQLGLTPEPEKPASPDKTDAPSLPPNATDPFAGTILEGQFGIKNGGIADSIGKFFEGGSANPPNDATGKNLIEQFGLQP